MVLTVGSKISRISSIWELVRKAYTGVPRWLSGLRNWCCHCCGSDHCCGMGSIPTQWTFHMLQARPKKCMFLDLLNHGLGVGSSKFRVVGFFFLFMAIPVAHGSSPGQELSWSCSWGLCHSHRNTGFEPRLKPTLQLAGAMNP